MTFIISKLNRMRLHYPLLLSIRTMSVCPKIHVKHLDDEEKLNIFFNLNIPDVISRKFTFLRNKNEELSLTLSRMSLKIAENIDKKTIKKKKKKLEDAVETQSPTKVSIELLRDDISLCDNVKNIDAWTEKTLVKINSITFEVQENPPTVLHLSLPKSIIAGFPVYPRIELEYCSKELSEFNWYRKVSEADKTNKDWSNNEIVKMDNEYWLHLSTGFFYVTKDSDVGAKLKLTCLPKSEDKVGLPDDTISPNPVDEGPGKCPFEDRHLFTKDPTDKDSLRYVSYNILADLYADSDTARNILFPYCPPEALMFDYRKQLYLKEIIGYNADIICLQEVDRKVFFGDLTPVLSSIEFEGIYSEKGGQVVEGLACFYRKSKFRVIESRTLILCDIVESDPVLQPFLSKISENEKLKERFMNRTTALQVVLLESLIDPRKTILVGNTHLYFHPESDNIRLLQATSFILYLQNMIQNYHRETSLSPSLIFCGDFNSCPEFGVYNLMTTQSLSEDCIDWQSNPEEKVGGIPLTHTLSLASACGTPDYTNYTAGFNGCLDYIFYDKSSFEVTHSVPLPKHEDVTRYTALPSKIFPSDHIALVCTLKWK